ncbi:HoxN/HupN/NixA family nickel/cobalt transporter [Agrobacterium sp. SHOUNA12C]|uniref:Nickel/cobalt efflux system n=2 Tax=Rhizobium rhizogenes TaxID=359 RepID=B9JFE8_RHIR8|nr:HoxN/HupN/NixA family nickel/cobalt transporter [Rhizobium rhizogenes]ACM26638.1 High-affinity nickel permease [Rhizobium rhizogenes K84]KAA6489646.1 HoxN/HupN/NixA family nickel/cobalt transporter [Agrobacterium sp. ICMP 7243]MCJ9721540.1 HoxN/HupN/NixA family nickel/cobalt transporter [Agrobacterium sp. BETTINA12B]MCJ9756320.1 HoxN/HupN/NixA family nickel/cobalt transporter [Agrobacterium sp. SHOUNA12C]OCJ06069.1 nickel transporter [Agrobacterium sp. 13-626]OCJ25724.1 nickel transporter 
MILNPFDDRIERSKTKIVVTYILLIAFNVAAWVWAWVAFADRPSLLGTAFLAYMFGLRHAFDADHIAAIDNVVRKLMQEKKQPYAVGFFFSLGHSSIVVLASIFIAATAAVMQGQFESFHDVGGVIGTGVSAVFLLLIGVANLFVLKGVWSAFSRARRGEKIADEDLDALLAGGGFLARIFRPMFKVVTRSWHMYPIGFLFGLGFDTATEIGLLGISAAQAAQGMSFWTILVFPALFTAGMSLMDTIDSTLMTGAYGWAFVKPVRKLWYNLTITAASVVVAIFIGGIEAIGLISDKLGLEGGVWSFIGDLNDNLANFGFAIVGIFLLSWLVSTVLYKAGGYDNLQINRS